MNLLGGRAWQANLFPLTSAEIADIDLGRYLLDGGLTQVYGSCRAWPPDSSRKAYRLQFTGRQHEEAAA